MKHDGHLALSDGRIPLVVGVTGHRDIRETDREELRKAVRRIFVDLHKHYPSSPIVLLDALAEGADWLVAEVALELKTEMEIELVAPLPLEVEDYVLDFKPEYHEKFYALLAKAKSHFVAPEIPGIEPENPGDQGTRDWAYAKAGHHIAAYSHILLALWDGNTEEKLGGTSQMVRRKLQGMPGGDALSNDTSIEFGPGTVFHIVTPRMSKPLPLAALETRKTYAAYHDVEDAEKLGDRRVFNHLLHQADLFNSDLLAAKKKDAAQFRKCLSYIQPSHEFGHLDPALQELLERFAAADGLAIRFQKARHFCLITLCILIVPVSFCLAGYHATDQTNRDSPLTWLTAFELFVGIALIVWGWAARNFYETKHLDYRALAEGLRVLFFWRLGGIRADVGSQYMAKHLPDISWIRRAIWASEPTPPQTTLSSSPSRAVLKHWLIDQRNYFKKAALRNRQLAERWESAANYLTIGALVLSLLILAVHSYFWLQGRPLPEEYHHRIHFSGMILVLLLALAGFAAALMEKLAFAQLSKQYLPMARAFEDAAERYQACFELGNGGRGLSILLKLGQAALRENGDWILLHRERPMEMKFG